MISEACPSCWLRRLALLVALRPRLEALLRLEHYLRNEATADLLVLRVLSCDHSMHGYAIAERIEQLSENVLQVGEGSLYPALHRMDEAGWIRSEWAKSDNNRRARYYRITAAGRRQLGQEQAEWQRGADAITRVLRLA